MALLPELVIVNGPLKISNVELALAKYPLPEFARVVVPLKILLPFPALSVAPVFSR
jgi:hypothetical protein